MDRPDLDPEAHRRALRGLARINALSRTSAAIWKGLAPWVRDDRLRVLDLACGGGDVPVALWKRARRARVGVEIEGRDRSELAVEVARERAEEAGAPLRYRTADVLEDPLPDGADVVMTSLFLHHLDPPEAVELLRRMSGAATRGVLVEDLRRCRWGSLLAAVIPRLVSSSPVVHVDARLSARAAYTVQEVRQLADRAGLAGTRVRRHWPARLQLTGTPGARAS